MAKRPLNPHTYIDIALRVRRKRQRLPPNLPIASAPAGDIRVHATTRRRRTCDRDLRFSSNYRIVSELPTIRKLSRDGSNRNAEKSKQERLAAFKGHLTGRAGENSGLV